MCFSGGFLYVDEVLSLPQLRNYTLDDVQRVVDTNEKKRFTMEPHPENGKPRIRANQGHSIEVWNAFFLEEISNIHISEPLTIIYRLCKVGETKEEVKL